jgi:Protein implicated in ribosomal biogenesis, Nop56p homolog
MQSYWFGDVRGDEYIPFTGSTGENAQRIMESHTGMDRYVPVEWTRVRDQGIVRDREDYLDKLREICFFIAEYKIAQHYRGRDIELLQMVRMLDEMDEVINLLTERAVDWYRVQNPKFTRKYRSLSGKKALVIMKKSEIGAFRMIIVEIERMASARTSLMYEVSARADQILPNCSALIGGLVAARLLSRAGGLLHLASLPASSIQVIGAKTALFSHIRSGTPPPKHGIIFQHRRVHNASKERRGRVARVLAAKLAIAARIDYYRQEADPEFIQKAQDAIERAGVVQ